MKILVISAISTEALFKLQEKHHVTCAFNPAQDDLKQIVQDKEVLIFRSGVQIDSDVMRNAEQLKLLIRAGSGMDNVDVEFAEKRNIQFRRIPEPAAKAVAEFTFGLMLCLARKIILADQAFRRGFWAKNQIEGYLLSGKVLGIVGVGSIGAFVGQLGNAFGMRVIGCVENPGPIREEHLRIKGIELKPFSEVIENADFLSIHVPLKANTRGLIDESVLARMKDGAHLLNLSRGGVVDEQALFDALSKGRLMGAAVDVHQIEGKGISSPLSSLSNVILTPHIGSQTMDTQQEIGKKVVEIVDAFTCTRNNTFSERGGVYEKDQTA